MDYVLNNFSAITICILLIVLSAIFSAIVLFVFRKFFTHMNLKENSDVSNTVFSAVSMLYSLIIAFVMSAVWQDYEDQNSIILEEATKLDKVKIEAASLPPILKGRIVTDINKYAELEYTKHITGNDLLYDLRTVVALNDSILQAHNSGTIDDYLVDVIQLNHNRYSQARSHIPSFVWFILLLGCFSIIVMICFFRSDFEYLYMLLVSSAISTCLIVIYILDHPLTDAAGLDYEPMMELIKNIQ